MGTKMELLRRLGATWGQLGGNMGQLEATWSHLGTILGHLGASWGQLGANLGRLGPTGEQKRTDINLGLHGNGKRESLEKLQKQVKVNLKGFCECCKNRLKPLFR